MLFHHFFLRYHKEKSNSLEELLLLEIESLEEMGLRDELIADWLVEIEEHEGHVLSDVLLDLADPLGMILAVLNHPVVGIETELDFLENLLGWIVRRLPVNGHRNRGVGRGHTGVERRQNAVEVRSIFHQRVELLVMLELRTCVLQVLKLLLA